MKPLAAGAVAGEAKDSGWRGGITELLKKDSRLFMTIEPSFPFKKDCATVAQTFQGANELDAEQSATQPIESGKNGLPIWRRNDSGSKLRAN